METNRNKSFVPSLLSELSCDVIAIGNHTAVKYSRDVINLLEEKKLAALDPQFVKDITSTLNTSDDSPKVSDEQLQMFCKSRYINNLTDVSTFSEKMDDILKKYGSEIDSIKADYIKMLEESQSKRVEENSSSES